MEEIFPVLAVIVGGSAVFSIVRGRFAADEFRLVVASFVAHLLASIAQVVLTRDVLGGGDMFSYHFYGNLFADMVWRDPTVYLPRILRLVFLDAEPDLPINVLGSGGATGAMFGIASLLHVVCFGSLYAVCMALGLGSLFGTIGLYFALKPDVEPALRIRVLAACVLMPSVVYWSSGLLKEAVAFVGFGWCVLALRWMVDGRWRAGAFLFVVAATPIALVKPYVLFPLVLAAGVWFYWRRAIANSVDRAVTIRPWHMFVGGLVAFAGVLALSKLFRYSVDVLADEIANHQEVGAVTQGTANYQLASTSSRSLGGQALYAPLALLTSLFRPFLLEVRNAPQFVNALETTALIIFSVTLGTRQPTGLGYRIRRSPTLAFAITFVLVFGTLVGLATTNLGTLSRYRIPLSPLFASLLVILRGHSASTVTSRAPRRPAVPAPSRGLVVSRPPGVRAP